MPERGRRPITAIHTTPAPRSAHRRAWQEGLPFILAAAGASAALARKSPILSLGSAAFALACTAFFRDPERVVTAASNDVISAADGVVMAVDRIIEPWWIQGEADRIAVFLSVLDVHVNRWPVKGRFAGVKRVPGRYAPAFLHGENNCKDLLAIDGPHGRVTLAQISGILARRSVQWSEVGDTFEAGERLGMIRFGSRTDIYVPAGSVEILVKVGDRVRAGETPIARYLG